MSQLILYDLHIFAGGWTYEHLTSISETVPETRYILYGRAEGDGGGLAGTVASSIRKHSLLMPKGGVHNIIEVTQRLFTSGDGHHSSLWVQVPISMLSQSWLL